MVARLFLLYIIPVFAVGWITGYKIFGPRLRERKLRQLGAARAERICNDPDCGLTVLPQDPRALYVEGHWYHENCYKKLLT